MARESFLLRTDPKILDALRRWADEDLRSANGQLEFILREALKKAGRLPERETPPSKDEK
ncbi:Arc family DNA-binding protein [Thalassoglobus sp. JC818]|uniref:Arc family DNA-binding protein n=1 Tax=Thalassoglobus sp. JC818 TaxID=3232136 RepID=UPI0034584462